MGSRGCPADKLGAWPAWSTLAAIDAEAAIHGSVSAAARAHGVKPNTVHRARQNKGGAPLRVGMKATPTPLRDPEESDDSDVLKALKKLGDAATVEELSDHLNCAPRYVREALERLAHGGFRVEAAEAHVVLHRVPPKRDHLHPALFDGEQVRVGIVSDTHLGANEEALAELHLAYDIFEREGISQVWHAGDVGCGVEVFGPKQHSEAHVHTLDEQAQYVISNYPKREGITTRAIGGNHDLEGLAGKAGWDLVRAVANERPDFDYLGPFEAWLETRPGTGRWIHLLHGKGGMSYSYSYKAQKLVDGYPSGRKPSALIVGHWHVRGNIRARDVEVLWPGCFEKQSSFMARLGLQPAVGFHVLNMTVADDGTIVRWMPEWFAMYPGRVVKYGA